MRLADGLDRRRNRQVEDIECRPNGKTFELELVGQGDLSVESYGAASKGELFAKAFGYDLQILAPECQ